VELARIGAGTISYSPQDICISYFVLLSERVANERRGAASLKEASHIEGKKAEFG